MRLVISVGLVALLAGSAAGQVFKPRGGSKSAPAASAKKERASKPKAKTGAKRKRKAKPKLDEVVVVDDDEDAPEDAAADTTADTARRPERPTKTTDDAGDARDSETQRKDPPRAKPAAARNKPPRWDPDFVLITDDDE